MMKKVEPYNVLKVGAIVFSGSIIKTQKKERVKIMVDASYYETSKNELLSLRFRNSVAHDAVIGFVRAMNRDGGIQMKRRLSEILERKFSEEMRPEDAAYLSKFVEKCAFIAGHRVKWQEEILLDFLAKLKGEKFSLLRNEVLSDENLFHGDALLRLMRTIRA